MMCVASKCFKALSRVHHLPHHRRLLRRLPLRRLSGTCSLFRILPSLNFGFSIPRSYRRSTSGLSSRSSRLPASISESRGLSFAARGSYTNTITTRQRRSGFAQQMSIFSSVFKSTDHFLD